MKIKDASFPSEFKLLIQTIFLTRKGNKSRLRAAQSVSDISAENEGPARSEVDGVWMRLTRRAERGFDEGFRSGCYRLHRPGLFGC